MGILAENSITLIKFCQSLNQRRERFGDCWKALWENNCIHGGPN